MLIPPSTANVERGFSVMNLICFPLRSSLKEANLDHFMRIFINGSDSLSSEQLEEMVDDFINNYHNRRMIL